MKNVRLLGISKAYVKALGQEIGRGCFGEQTGICDGVIKDGVTYHDLWTLKKNCLGNRRSY